MQTRQCRMTCKGLLTYLGVEVIVFHTSFRAQMGTFYLSLHGFVFQKSSSRFTENICTILNARALTAWRRKLDVTKESSCASVTNKFHSGKLCSAPPNKIFPVRQCISGTFYQCHFQKMVGWVAFKVSLLFMLKFKII